MLVVNLKCITGDYWDSKKKVAVTFSYTRRMRVIVFTDDGALQLLLSFFQLVTQTLVKTSAAILC